MTVPVASERNDYVGDGATHVYAYSYRITDDDHLLVTVADADGAETKLTKTTDYTVSGVGVKTGGNVTLVNNSQAWLTSGELKSGYALTIRHVVPLAQATDVRNQGTFYPEIHEDAFDYLMWVCKQQQDEIDRSIKAGETVTGLTISFPSPEDGKSLIWSGTSGAMINSDLRGEKGETGDTGPTGPAGADGVFSEIASQAEAEAGTENTKGMTALRTAQAIAALTDASEITLTAEPGSDHTATGIKINLTAAQTVNFGDVCYIASNGKATLIDADAIATMSGICMALATIAGDASGSFLLLGIVRDDTWNWTVGGLIYGSVTGTTGNTLTQTAPSGTDDVVQILGVATHADRMFFNPSLSQIELT